MKSVKQRDWSDCGVACLAAIASHYDLRLSVAQIRQLTGTDQSGTSVLGLVHASKQLGFIAKAVKAQTDELSGIAFPAIAHVLVRGKHFHYVVVLRIKKSRVTVMDPATGRFSRYPIHQFEQMWTGVLVLMAPGICVQPPDNRTSRFARYSQLHRPHRSSLVQALFGAVLGILLTFTGSFYIQKV